MCSPGMIVLPGLSHGVPYPCVDRLFALLAVFGLTFVPVSGRGGRGRTHDDNDVIIINYHRRRVTDERAPPAATTRARACAHAPWSDAALYERRTRHKGRKHIVTVSRRRGIVWRARVCIINNINDMFTGSRARPLKTDQRDPVSVSAIFTRLCVCDPPPPSPPYVCTSTGRVFLPFVLFVFFSIRWQTATGKGHSLPGMIIHQAWPRTRAQVRFRGTFTKRVIRWWPAVLPSRCPPVINHHSKIYSMRNAGFRTFDAQG